MSLSARLALVLLGLVTLLGTHWRAYSLGARHERNATQAAQVQAVRESAAAAIRNADNIIEATHDRAQTERRIAADRLSVGGELDRLRADMSAARAVAASADTCTADGAARDQLLAAMAADLATLAQQGGAIAAAADGHAADALMLWRAASGR